MFENDVSEIIVDEKCKIGEKIFRIRAIDGDKSAQPQSRIRYSISDNNFFDIETLSGWIILKKDLNQHSTDSIKIIVKASFKTLFQPSIFNLLLIIYIYICY